MNTLRVEFCRGHFQLDINTHVPLQGITAVYGENGSGKTTLLEAIAGLLPQASVQLLNASGSTLGWIALPLKRRRVGYIPQSPSLFSHLTVEKNIAYGRHRFSESCNNTELQAIKNTLELGSLWDRMPGQLSGGQQQRVALARALVIKPKILLMDEAVTAIDARRRRLVLDRIRHFSRLWAMPVFLVSHQLEDIAQAADHVLVLDQGQVRESCDAQDWFARLNNVISDTPQAGCLFHVTVGQRSSTTGLTPLRFSGGTIQVPGRVTGAGSQVRLRVSASDVSISLTAAADSSILNILPAKVVRLRDQRDGRCLVQLQLGEALLNASITRFSADRLKLRSGASVFAQIKSVALCTGDFSTE